MDTTTPIGARRAIRGSGGYAISVHEEGEGPAIVFIHGSGPGASGVSNFRQNMPAFLAAGFRAIVPDLIGYGDSDKPTGIDYTLDLFTDTLHEALTAMGVTRATLIGNSLGGGIAILLALRHPGLVHRLILMSPGCVEERETYFAMPGIAKMVGDFTSPDFTEADQRRLLCNLVRDPSIITDELVAERFRVARTQPKDVLARMRTPNLAGRLGELTMPILGFWGEEDQFLPVSGVHHFTRACPDCRFVIFSRVGHWVMVERAAEFNRHALDFLAA
jgi:4,5:9,10-diseco-3-hydroxy-5,9,17-trioxoandrosta-1(10),2-diene-4-oate hydrolase